MGYASNGHVLTTAKGWPSAMMFRACLAEQDAVALDAEFKIGMRMAISYSAVQPRVLSKSGKARGGAPSHRTCPPDSSE